MATGIPWLCVEQGNYCLNVISTCILFYYRFSYPLSMKFVIVVTTLHLSDCWHQNFFQADLPFLVKRRMTIVDKRPQRTAGGIFVLLNQRGRIIIIYHEATRLGYRGPHIRALTFRSPFLFTTLFSSDMAGTAASSSDGQAAEQPRPRRKPGRVPVSCAECRR